MDYGLRTLEVRFLFLVHQWTDEMKMGLNRYKEERKKEIFDERANFGRSTSSLNVTQTPEQMSPMKCSFIAFSIGIII